MHNDDGYDVDGCLERLVAAALTVAVALILWGMMHG